MTSETQEQLTLKRLSAVMDGEADEASLSSACAAWREAEDDRATWHAWHLIGDVMRSEDLASSASRDAAFLASFRAKLADEPVVLAPSVAYESEKTVVSAGIDQAMVANAGRIRRNRSWTASAAVAAGFVVVAGAVLVLQRPVPTVPQPIAQAPQAVPNILPASVSKPMQAEAPLVADGQMIRNARLQQYLAAHKQFGGATALGVPSGFLRSATVDTPSR